MNGISMDSIRVDFEQMRAAQVGEWITTTTTGLFTLVAVAGSLAFLLIPYLVKMWLMFALGPVSAQSAEDKA